MARSTPAPNRWMPQSSTMNDFANAETRPLLADQPRASASPSNEVRSNKQQPQQQQQHHDIPIDGAVAWLQVLSGWVLFANSWGLPNCFGVFQTYYLNTLLPHQNASSIAWIGSIQLFFTTLGCLPGGLLLDRGYLRSLIAAGTALEVAGLLFTSCSTKYWQIFLAQGVCMGVGSGILALLPVAVISKCFEAHRMTATGVAATGASFAGIVYTLALRSLFNNVGFAWTVRILTLIILASNTVPLAIMRLKQSTSNTESQFGLHHFRDWPYTAFVCSFTLLMASTFAPFFFIQQYALKLGISEDMSFHLLAIMNTANLFGRFVPNFIADRYGGINTLLPLSLVCILLLCLHSITTSLPTLIVLTVLYGFFSGGVIILPAPIIANLSPNHAEMGVRMGLAYLIAAFGGLVGNPLSGAVKGDGEGPAKNFSYVWWSAAGIMIAGVGAMVVTRWLKLGALWRLGRV